MTFEGLSSTTTETAQIFATINQIQLLITSAEQLVE